MTAALTVLLPGMVAALGLLVTVLAFRPEYVRLDDALASLSETPAAPLIRTTDVPSGERLGAWWLRTRRVAVVPALRRRLQLRGQSVTGFYTDKLVYSIGGFVLPLVVGGLAVATGQSELTVPLIASVAGAVMGFFVPDLRVRQDSAAVRADATESLLTYFDLVTLERLANQSATQSLHSAAALSDSAIFTTIRAALDRARLEQRMPFAELKDVGHHMELPALVDLADVMRLDESGAALSTTLRARVKELRDAHLTAMKMAANDVSERMTVFMVIPSLIFGLIFLTPPLLKLLGG